jgi:hypothetical protein
MPRGDKSKYTDKQIRKAQDIEESYQSRGVSEKEAERRAWATVTRTTTAARSPGAPDAAGRPAIRLPIAAENWAAQPLRNGPLLSVPPPRERPPRHDGRRHEAWQ